MAIAAKKMSQVTAHMGIAFGLMYVLTGQWPSAALLRCWSR